jgi:L-seryl-tRNA(Ser) seleniumtransferase
MPSFRHIPSVDALLQQPAVDGLIARYGRVQVVAAARRAVDELRAALAAESDAATTVDDALAWTATRLGADLTSSLAPSLRGVINATGVVIHTNLGRSPLAPTALTHGAAIAAGYSNLEYDLHAGHRGRRDSHAERLLTRLTGAEAGVIVNNNAAATLLVLAALANGREVIVSRGELVEIGGGFRVPEVMAQSGAILREVGTTNRTRTADYAPAISDKTALILRVHPSNFRIDGFTERPAVAELSALAHRFHLPLFEDLGSGWLDDSIEVPALREEPSVAGSLRAGVDLVAFSGDKLLGGPQAGVIVGRHDLVERARVHPLMRAMRADKLTYAVLETTLELWLRPETRQDLPVYRMLTMTADEIGRRTDAFVAALGGVRGLGWAIVRGCSTTGGGTAPESALPTYLIALSVEGLSASALDRRLRHGDPPVVSRIVDDAVVIDLRTVQANETAALAGTIRAAAMATDDRVRG